MVEAVVLVGGSGKVGRALARSLVSDGIDVVTLSRDPRTAKRRGAVGRIEPWSVDNPQTLATVLAGSRAVVNLAGVPVGPWPWWVPGRRRGIVDSRIATTRAIVDALAQISPAERPGVFVSASGTDGYEGHDAVPATEATPSGDGFLAHLCRAWEKEARRGSALDVRVPIVRIGFVLARGAPALAIYTLPFRLGIGGRIGSGRQWMSWIHIDDLVGILRLAIEDVRASGPINAVSPQPARQAEVAAAIGAALGRRPWLPVPAPLLRLTMGAASVLPLGSRRVLPERASALGYHFRWQDLRTAMQDVLRDQP